LENTSFLNLRFFLIFVATRIRRWYLLFKNTKLCDFWHAGTVKISTKRLFPTSSPECCVIPAMLQKLFANKKEHDTLSDTRHVLFLFPLLNFLLL